MLYNAAAFCFRIVPINLVSHSALRSSETLGSSIFIIYLSVISDLNFSLVGMSITSLAFVHLIASVVNVDELLASSKYIQEISVS